MPFDKLDKKAREAAEHYDASYNEESWSKMEALLDKHMPVDAPKPVAKERKFHEKWLLLLLSFITISFVVLLVKPWKNGRGSNIATQNANTTKHSEAKRPNETTLNSNEHVSGDKSNSNIQSAHETATAIIVPEKPVGKNAHHTQGNIPKDLKSRKGLLRATTTGGETGINENDNEMQALVYGQEDVNLHQRFINQKIDNKVILNRNILSINISYPKSLASNQGADVNKTKNLLNPRKNKFSSSFSVSLSAGSDVSAVSINNIGAFEILYGAGLGYKFSKRWQVRTGFYTSKKVYGAKPYNYNPPGMFWNYYPNLENISADCRVYEIPLIVNYSFSQNQKRAWFASAGLSSYIMKRETYTYHSKSPAGVYSEKSYTISDENKHYLSSLRLSAGYEKKINQIISLSAEPYLNLPLSGVGYGKVKLTSAGFLFSLQVKPFTKK